MLAILPGGELSVTSDPNMTLYRAAWDNPSPSPSRQRTSTKTTYLPWLLGAGALAYLIFFRKKG